MASRLFSAFGDKDVLIATWRQHHFVLIPSAAPAVITGVVAYLLNSTVNTIFFTCLAMIFLIRFAWKAIQWQTDKILVTNKQIIRISGLLAQETTVLPLTHVIALTYRRSVLGRMFGYGRCILETARQPQPSIALSYMSTEHYSILRQLLSSSRGQ